MGFRLLWPIEDNVAAFSNYWHSAPEGNPLAIAKRVITDSPQISVRWIVRKDLADLVPGEFQAVFPGSWQHARLMATAKFFVNDVNFPTWWSPRRSQIFLQAQHGLSTLFEK